MHYHLAVCDDREADALTVEMLALEWAEKCGHQVNVDIFPSAESFLFSYAEDKSYDILLLDIEMGGEDGVSLAKTIRRENETVQIVFITGYSDYIAEGYEVSALHYLLKPINAAKLSDVLTRAAARLEKSEQALLLELVGETVRLPLREIRWIEVRGNYVTVHARQDYTVKNTLSRLAAQLDEGFFRTGRSFIVNLTCIRRVSRTEIELLSGERIPLPRGMYETLNRAIIDRV